MEDPYISEQEFVMAKKAAAKGNKAMSKSQVVNALADKTGLSKKDVSGLFDALTDLISDQLGKRGPEVFTVPGLMKLVVKHKPAQKAGMKKNAFTGEMYMAAAKPASKAVRIRPLKGLKDLVQ